MLSSIKSLSYKNKTIFLLMMVVLSIIIFFANYDGDIDSYNTTILALNYTYGFTSRGLIGTLYYLLDMILPVSMYTPTSAKVFLFISTLLLVVVLFIFVHEVIKKCHETHIAHVEILLMFLIVATISTYFGGWNFGRVDIYMIMISLLSAIIFIHGKCEWLIIPLSVLGVMMHQGYVFMYYNIILALLIWGIFSNKDKRRRYIVIAVISLIFCSALFLYFELFSHNYVDNTVFDQVAGLAADMSEDGEYHKTLLAHEILGVDLSGVEHEYHMKNLAEIILFALFMLPYIIIFFKLMVRVFKNANSKADKWKYALLYLGALTMLPDYLIKVDYGRWIMSTIAYYLIIGCFLYIKDEGFAMTATNYFEGIKKQLIIYPLLIAYPVFFVPYLDVNIDSITAIFGHVANREILHWWTF